MSEGELFRRRVSERLDMIGEGALVYDENEFWMLERLYHYVEDYAREHRMFNTCVALPVVRALHNGVHRKGTVLRDGVAWRLPYMIHCLMVCRMLIDLDLPLEAGEEDVLLASSLCHDLIEDIPFKEGGREIVTVYGLDERVYDTVKVLSKRKDFTEEEHCAYFRGIQETPFALLIKLSDRGNNVEDMYNMKTWKIAEYVQETRECIYPMAAYGIAHYPKLAPCIEIMWDKMRNLTRMAEYLAARYDERERELQERLAILRLENARLRNILQTMEEV